MDGTNKRDVAEDSVELVGQNPPIHHQNLAEHIDVQHIVKHC